MAEEEEKKHRQLSRNRVGDPWGSASLPSQTDVLKFRAYTDLIPQAARDLKPYLHSGCCRYYHNENLVSAFSHESSCERFDWLKHVAAVLALQLC